MIRAVLAFDDASFKEADHKRDKGGKFSTTGGGGGAQGAAPAAGEGEKGGAGGKYHVHYKMVSLLKDNGFKQAKGGPAPDGNFHFDHPSGAKVVIHPHPEGKKSSTEYTLEKPGSEPLKGSGLALKKLLDLAVEKQNAANPPAAEPPKAEPPATIEKLNEALATIEKLDEALASPSTGTEGIQAATALTAAGYKPTKETDGKTITYKKDTGASVEFDPASGDWLASTPGYQTKEGNGAENLAALLAGGKATEKNGEFTWKNSAKTSLAGGTSSGGAAPSSSSSNEPPEDDTHKMLAKAAPKPTAQERAAIYDYTGAGYGEWNTNLRHDPSFAAKDMPTKRLDQYLARATIPEDVTLYRKIGGEFARHLFSVLFVGAKYNDKGYSSTSTHQETWNGEVQMVIDVKKGAKGASVKATSDHKKENEVLLARDTRYIVNKIDHATKTLHVSIDQDHVPKG